MIHGLNAVSPPAMIDDINLGDDVEGTQPDGVAPQLGLFVSSGDLLNILEKVLKLPVVVANDPAGSRAEHLARVLELNRRLDRFSSGLPSYLKVDDPTERHIPRANHVNLQQQVLHCRYVKLSHQLRCKLHANGLTGSCLHGLSYYDHSSCKSHR